MEYAPPAALAQYVDCFWSRPASAGTTDGRRPHRVLPDGCVDIIVAFGDVPPSLTAVGTMTRPLVFDSAMRTSFLGVRFRAGVARTLFGIPADELTDDRVALAALWPDTGPLLDALAGAVGSQERTRVLTRSIARHLLAAPPAPPEVSAAAALITASRGRLSIRALANRLGVTRQHLARVFAQHVGVSPKALARVVRARTVLARATARAGDVDWTALALDAGYYDQSHLIADFRELTGLTPSAWLSDGA